MEPVCFLDLDGVLVDFTKGALAVHGKSLEADEIRWDFALQIGFDDPNHPDFWRPFGCSFWEDLEWTHEGPELLHGLEELFGDNIALLTAAPKTAGSVEGKVNWVRRHLPKYSRKLFVGANKHLMAGPHKFLVDDKNENILDFQSSGGVGLLVPRPWNDLRHKCTEGKFEAKGLLKRLEELLDPNHRNYYVRPY